MGIKRLIRSALREMAGRPGDAPRAQAESPRKGILPVDPPVWRPAVHCGDGIVLTQTIFGHKIYVSGRDLDIAPHLIVNGYWEAWITAFLDRQLAPGDSFVDVGANVGYYALLAAYKVGARGKVLAVEPDPETFQLLARNAYVNGLTEIIALEQAALGDHDGEATLYARSDHKGASTLQSGWRSWREPWTITPVALPVPPAASASASASAAVATPAATLTATLTATPVATPVATDAPAANAGLAAHAAHAAASGSPATAPRDTILAGTSPARAIPVRMVRLDALADRLPLERALIKMDAEGAEASIVEGMRETIARHGRSLRIVLEFAPAMIADAGHDPAQFLARLRADGFSIGRVDYEGNLAPVEDHLVLAEPLTTLALAAHASVWR